tara:strand:+ start:599 stop:1075 length:477 start_codon:yes stop_codon:yes gene_type:complete
MDIRVGNGYDTHPLVKGESLILGGINIPHVKGTKGHSDGDVLTHAIIDSLLGATSLGDIGNFFPSNSKKFENISSLKLLSKIVNKINKKSYQILNSDSTIILEKPIIKEHIHKIKTSISSVLLISEDRVSIKATTNDKLGFIGQEKGISVISSTLVKR